jgi:hypothetical protein
MAMASPHTLRASSVDWTFRRNPAYAVTRGEWLRAGLGRLLSDGTLH